MNGIAKWTAIILAVLTLGSMAGAILGGIKILMGENRNGKHGRTRQERDKEA